MKTTIDIPEPLWKQFTLKVVEKEGTRKNNQVIVGLIKKYVVGIAFVSHVPRSASKKRKSQTPKMDW